MNFHLDMPRVPDLLKNCSNEEPYKNVSYDVESLFTSIPVQDEGSYSTEIYVRKEIKPFCKKSIFKKLTKESAFSVNNRLIKQTDGCPMGGLISAFISLKWKKTSLLQWSHTFIKDM